MPKPTISSKDSTGATSTHSLPKNDAPRVALKSKNSRIVSAQKAPSMRRTTTQYNPAYEAKGPREGLGQFMWRLYLKGNITPSEYNAFKRHPGKHVTSEEIINALPGNTDNFWASVHNADAESPDNS